MIESPEEYEHVDFETGDMPTSKINGEIMPLRTGDEREKLRGVDIAFLYEAAVERLTRFDGTEIPGGAKYTASKDKLVPTKKLSAEQMTKVVRIVNELGAERSYPWAGRPSGALAVRYLANDLVAGHRVNLPYDNIPFDDYVKPKLVVGSEFCDVVRGDRFDFSLVSDAFAAVRAASRQVMIVNPRHPDEQLVQVYGSVERHVELSAGNFAYVGCTAVDHASYVLAYPRREIVRLPEGISVGRVWAVFFSADYPTIPDFTYMSALFDVSADVSVETVGQRSSIWMDERQSLSILLKYFAATGTAFPFQIGQHDSFALECNMLYLIVEVGDVSNTKWWDDEVSERG